MSQFANTPEAPYYAVIFTSQRTEGDNGYGAMAERIDAFAQKQPGYLGIESVRGEDGFGMTVSYWASLDAIREWKRHEEHLVAQGKGRSDWYSAYKVRICKVERDYGFEKL